MSPFFFPEDMDRPLPAGARLRLRLHVLICDACERYRQQLRVIRETIRRHPDQVMGQNVPAGMSPEARERLAQALRKKQQP
jgi:hypothetical protein